MHAFNSTTRTLFRQYRFAVRKHISNVVSAVDRRELNRAVHAFHQKKMRQRECEHCAVLVRNGNTGSDAICNEHYHDAYDNNGPECCWRCYVRTVFDEQIGISI